MGDTVSDRMTIANGPVDDHLLIPVIDFLRGFHQVTRLPVRDIAEFKQFLQRQDGLPGAPAVEIRPSESTWMRAVLFDPLPPPDIPPALSKWVLAVSASAPPTIDLDDDTSEAALEAAIFLDDWIETTWRPWAARRREIEAGRSFYKSLFALRMLLEREGDSLELVWGFGRLRWTTPQGLIDHPLLVAPVEISFDAGDARGALKVAPSGLLELELSFLTEVVLSNRPEYLAIRDSGAADDLAVWDDESRAAFLERIQRLLDHDGSCGPIAGPSPRAAVSDEWVLYVRRRDADYLGFLEAQRQLLRDGAEPSDPLRSLVALSPSALDQGTAGAPQERSEALSGDVLYLPKPANEEQHRVLRYAQDRVGVTTQGPPGTGKSHTIANLVCHYVALGQRVLVTAEKEAALEVLADKLPARIRELSVSVLGSDVASRMRLETAIKSISSRVNEYDESYVDREIAQFTRDLDETDRSIARAGNQFRDASAFEARPLVGTFAAGVDPTPSAVAAWLAENDERLSFVPDSLPLQTANPLSQEEWLDLGRLGQRITPYDAALCALIRPNPGRVPSGAILDAKSAQLDELRIALADVDGLQPNWDLVDATTPERLDEIRDAVATAAEWRQKTVGTWLDRVRIESADPVVRTGWQEFVDDVRATREGALVNRQALAAYQVSIPEVPEPNLEADLDEARERFAAGKGVSKVLHRSAARSLQACTVDGHKPRTADEASLCLAAIRRQAHQRRLVNLWTNSMPRVGGPDLDPTRSPEDAVAEHLDALTSALTWGTATWPAAVNAVSALGISTTDDPDPDELAALVAGLDVIAHRGDERQLTRDLSELTTYLASGTGDGGSTHWLDLSTALSGRQWATWDEVVRELRRLDALAPDAARLADLADRLKAVAPEYQRILETQRYSSPPSWETLTYAWQWRQLDDWLREATSGPTAAELQREIEMLTARRLRIMEDLVAVRAWRGLVDNFNDRKRASLNKYLAATKRHGKTGGKYKNRWLREIREALDESKDAVPVWIMPITKALSSFRPAPTPPFDVIIVDEASQIGLLGLPILSLARRAIVVGDDQQTSPENVGLNQQAVFDLIDTHLGAVPDARTVFDPNQSLYDVAQQKFPQVVVLREHFRCLPDIIAFSNSRYYGNMMIPLRDRPPVPHWHQVGTVFVPDGYRNAKDVNEPEAEAVVDLITRCCADPDYEEMTFGVIALLGHAQARQVEDLLIDRIGPAEMERRRVRCGDAPAFQGDERDVMILSLVVDKPNNGRIGAMTRPADLRRINVAASRAANQMWIVHSIPPEDFPNGDPRAELIRHCQNPREIDAIYDDLEERCDSDFERQVLHRILNRGYRRVHTQYEVGRKRIDIVVEGPESRLAVEVDGEAYHGPDRWEEDRARQQTLERAGWRFERIRGSAFYRDPDAALEPLWERLEELGIPTGDWWNEPRPRRDPIVSSRPPAHEPAAAPEPNPLPAAVPPHSDTFGRPVATPTPRLAPPASPAKAQARPTRIERLSGTDDEADNNPGLVLSFGEDDAGDTATDDDWEETSDAVRMDEELLSAPPARGDRATVSAPLAPYVAWAGSIATPVDSTAHAELVRQLTAIVAAEGPVHALRLYQLHAAASGAQRVGKQMKRSYNRALSRAIRDGHLAQINDDLSGLIDKTIYAPETQPVRLRTLGPRELVEVPRSEVRTLIERLGLTNAPSDQQKRAILGAYGLRRLTQRASTYLDSCISYSWRA